MWEQLSTADPPLVCSKDIELFVKYQDHRKFIHFMMGLREDFGAYYIGLICLIYISNRIDIGIQTRIREMMAA